MWEDIVSIKILRMNNKLYLFVCNKNKKLDCCIYLQTNEIFEVLFINKLSLLWIHVINIQQTLTISTIPEARNHLIIGLIFSSFFSSVLNKRIKYLVFVGYEGDYCFFDDDVHPFTSSFMILTRLLLIHWHIPMSSSSLLISFISSFIISTWFLLLHFRILISSTALLLFFTSSFII